MDPRPDADDLQGRGSLLVRAMRGESVERVPVWFMRQAGRSLPEYRALRSRGGLLELCADPALAAEITMQPVRRHGVDAAILFSDIVVPLHAIGIGVEIRPGVGPVIDEPLRNWDGLERLRPFEPDVDAPQIAEAVRLTRAELDVPVIGFAGAPFTVASYLVEGGPSKVQARTRALMMSDPQLWNALCRRLSDIAVASLESQVRAGAAAVQLFDSWAGILSAEAYAEHVLPAMRGLISRLRPLGGRQASQIQRLRQIADCRRILALGIVDGATQRQRSRNRRSLEGAAGYRLCIVLEGVLALTGGLRRLARFEKPNGLLARHARLDGGRHRTGWFRLRLLRRPFGRRLSFRLLRTRRCRLSLLGKRRPSQRHQPGHGRGEACNEHRAEDGLRHPDRFPAPNARNLRRSLHQSAFVPVPARPSIQCFNSRRHERVPAIPLRRSEPPAIQIPLFAPARSDSRST